MAICQPVQPGQSENPILSGVSAFAAIGALPRPKHTSETAQAILATLLIQSSFKDFVGTSGKQARKMPRKVKQASASFLKKRSKKLLLNQSWGAATSAVTFLNLNLHNLRNLRIALACFLH
jgi:hypothetical protein